MTTEQNNTPVIRMSIQAGIGDARAVTFETYLAATSSPELICAMLDKLNFCIDRSKAAYDVEAIETQIQQETKLYNGMKDNLVLIDSKVANRIATGGKLGAKANQPNEQEKKTREQVVASLKDRQERLEMLAAEVAKKKALINAGAHNGPSSAANS